MPRPTRNRRSTKHRGNAAGMIESRGRTGRKPKPEEKRSGSGRGGAGSSRESARGKRRDKPPTWRGSIVRAAFAAVLVYVVILFLNRHSSATSSLVILPIVLVAYVPLVYYTDLFMYRRAQRKKTGG